MTHNPSLHEYPRDQKAPVIPTQRNASILDWLESTGRLLESEPQAFNYLDNSEEEEISELMAGDDNSYDLDDDDEDIDLED